LAGDYEKALENGLNGLRVSQEAGFELFEVYALDLIGKSNLKLGNPEEAIRYLGEALVSSGNLESKVTESLILLNLGQAYDDMQQFDRAKDYLLQSIKTAQSIEARGELYKAHLLLSEIYEQQEDFAQALYHFRRHYEFKELVFNEKADERLKVLQVARDTETAKKETEILQLKTKQLEQEITERRKVEEVLQEARDKLEEQVKIRTSELSDTIALLNAEIRERERAEAEIQQMVEMLEQRVANRTKELATFFDLAMLASESLDLNEVLYPAISRIAMVSRCSIALIHLFDDGGVSLQLTAQYGFQDDDIHNLEEIRLYDSIRNWLSSFKESIVESNQFDTTKMPDVLRLPGRHYLGAQIRARGQPLGLLSCYRDSNHAFTLEDISLLTALAEQLGVVIENYRLRQQLEEMVLVKERQRLARELHDSITQSLYSQTLFARAGRYAYEDGDTGKLNSSMEQIEASSLSALKEMRMLLFHLQPPSLGEGGLETAINDRLDMVERRLEIETVCHIDEDISFPALVEDAIYRIILEALNNSLKHANASQVSIRVVVEMGQVILEITDNGHGFEINQDHRGMGLQSMRERASIAGGDLEIITRPNKGTIVRALFGDIQEMPPN
jgi:signal transduction histidine kinase